ncbi:COG4315 family predicted lipoprotein [Streptomyces violaceorubidus]|uniref:Lipoprotein n=1 Tax=Streptomyces violaceorubidus TaxID=284042 RepID=A0ABV1SRQ2_9ACTN
MKQHTRTVAVLASVLLLASAAAGCSDSDGDSGGDGTETHNAAADLDTDVVPAATSSASPAVDVKNGTYGKMLVDEKGRTLYLFEKDTKDKSMCDGDCAKAWPPFTVKAAPTAGGGVKKDLLKTIKRDDGSEQVAYNGHPLYRFADDQKAGDTHGQDVDAFGAKWFVVDPEGKKITTKPQNNDGGY